MVKKENFYNQNLFAVILIILTIFLFLNFTYINRNADNGVGTSPDENLALFFSENFVETSSVTWHSDLNEEFNVSFFKPRLAREVKENTYMGQYPGFDLVLSIARLYGFLDYIVGLMGIIGILAIFLLGREVFDARVGIYSACLYSFIPTYTLYANKFYSNVPAVSLAILSILYLFKGLKKQNKSYYRFYILTGIFLGLSIIIRKDFAILVLPIVIILLINKTHVKFRDVILGVFSFMIITVPWYLSFYRLLSSPSSDGNPSPTNELIYHQLTAFVPNPEAYLFVFKNYILFNPPILGFIGILGLIWILKYKKKDLICRSFSYLLLSMLILYFMFYATRTGTWNYWEVSIDASIFRYFIPLYAILSICCIAFLLNNKFLRKNKVLICIMLLVLIPSSIITSYDQGLIDDVNRQQIYSYTKSSIENLPKDAILFTKYYDKIVGTSRYVATYRTYDDIQKNKELIYFFTPVNIDNDIIPVIDTLLQSKRPVYVISDGVDLIESLKEHNYELKQIKAGIDIWEVNKKQL